MSSATIRVVTERGEFESLVGVWYELIQDVGSDNSIYLTHEWLSTWWKYFGAGKKLNILLIEKQGQVIGIVPLMRTEYRIGLLRVCALETIGSEYCNYVGLVRSGNGEEAITTLIAYLEDELVENRLVLLLDLVPEDSKVLAILRSGSHLLSENLAVQERVTTQAPYVALPATWDEYYHSLRRKLRQKLRRASQSLQEAHSVQFQECNKDNLGHMLSEFFDLHQRRWGSVNTGRWFSDPRMRAFYEDIATQFIKKGWLHFSSLNIDGRMANAQYGYVYNCKFYAVMVARDTRYSEYSIGHLHDKFLIEEMIGKQLKEFDYSRGDEPYKFYWAKSARKYIQVSIIGKGLCTGIRFKFLRVFLRLYVIRQNGLRASYRLRLMRKRQEEEKKRMGLPKRLR
jgi:CelD/BcsL family acetyltransferase involved in cellulose biosynthesis